MNDLLLILLGAAPIAVAILLGKLSTNQKLNPIGVVSMCTASLYPLAHWYLLHHGLGVANDPNNKDDIVGASVLWFLMIAEIPICLIMFLITRYVGRLSQKSYRDF